MDIVKSYGGNNHQRTSLVATAVASGVAAVIAWQLYTRTTGKNRHPPPPLAKANIWQTIAGFTDGGMHRFMIDQLVKCGSVYRLAIPGVVIVANSEDARAIYKDPLSTKARALYSATEYFTSGVSILSIADKGDAWHHRRKGINPAFAPKHIKRMNDVAMEKVETWVKESLRPCVENDRAFDIGVEMILLTVSVICKAAFEYDISDEEGKGLVGAVRDCLDEFTYKSMLNPLRRFGTWVLPDRQHAFQQANLLKNFATKLIKLHRQKCHSDDSQTVLDVIIKNDEYKDDSERASDIIMILIAGHDTTGSTIAFALMELAKPPTNNASYVTNWFRPCLFQLHT